MRAIIWSKNNCILCTKAKNLLERKGINYEERNVEGPDWTPEQFFEVVSNARTFPQIYLDGKYIGGYDMMISHWQLGELRL